MRTGKRAFPAHPYATQAITSTNKPFIAGWSVSKSRLAAMRRGRALVTVLVALGVLAVCLAGQERTVPDKPAWSQTANTHKPWVRWWWPGSAVDKENLTRQLEELARVGV